MNLIAMRTNLACVNTTNRLIFRQKSDQTTLCASSDTEMPIRPGSATNAEKDLLRYYYYIHNGIDTGKY